MSTGDPQILLKADADRIYTPLINMFCTMQQANPKIASEANRDNRKAFAMLFTSGDHRTDKYLKAD